MGKKCDKNGVKIATKWNKKNCDKWKKMATK